MFVCLSIFEYFKHNCTFGVLSVILMSVIGCLRCIIVVLLVFRVGGGMFWSVVTGCDGTIYVGDGVAVCVVIENLGMIIVNTLDVIRFRGMFRT